MLLVYCKAKPQSPAEVMFQKYRSLKISTWAHHNENPDVIFADIAKGANSEILQASFKDDACRKFKIEQPSAASEVGVEFSLVVDYCAAPACDNCQKISYSCNVYKAALENSTGNYVGQSADGIPCKKN